MNMHGTQYLVVAPLAWISAAMSVMYQSEFHESMLNMSLTFWTEFNNFNDLLIYAAAPSVLNNTWWNKVLIDWLIDWNIFFKHETKIISCTNVSKIKDNK